MGIKKIESFCLSSDENYLFAGNIAGELLTVSTHDLAILHRTQAHPGGIIAVAAHKNLPYIVSMGMDRSITLFEIEENGRLRFMDSFLIRDIQSDNDKEYYQYILSVSQALNFHHTAKKIITRSGNAGVLELSFENGKIEIIRCTRLHGIYDVVSMCYAGNSDQVLTGSNHGEVILSEHGTPLRYWRFGHETIHWFEPVKENEFLIASDMRAVIRFHINDAYTPVIYEDISRDDLEHVTCNPVSGKAYASSFDRNIYRIDPVTCAPLEIAYTTPFKNRWIKTLVKDPDKMFIQCRNGALYMISLETKELLATIRETPYALWTAETDEENNILLAGEGNFMVKLSLSHQATKNKEDEWDVQLQEIDVDERYYTKRLVYLDGHVILGRTDGSVIKVMHDGTTRTLYHTGSAVRDLAVKTATGELFIATESGQVFCIHPVTERQQCIYTSPRHEPIWAIAYNNESDVLAIAEREGYLLFLDGSDFSLIMEDTDCRRPKRLKWLNHDTVCYGNGANFFSINTSTWEKKCILQNVGNTIEDFCWDPGKRYMIMINYQRNIMLTDIHRGQLLCTISDDIDYSKGILWLPEGYGYPYSFITFGRSGKVLRYYVHDEKIVPAGALDQSQVFPAQHTPTRVSAQNIIPV